MKYWILVKIRIPLFTDSLKGNKTTPLISTTLLSLLCIGRHKIETVTQGSRLLVDLSRRARRVTNAKQKPSSWGIIALTRCLPNIEQFFNHEDCRMPFVLQLVNRRIKASHLHQESRENKESFVQKGEKIYCHAMEKSLAEKFEPELSWTLPRYATKVGWLALGPILWSRLRLAPMRGIFMASGLTIQGASGSHSLPNHFSRGVRKSEGLLPVSSGHACARSRVRESRYLDWLSLAWLSARSWMTS